MHKETFTCVCGAKVEYDNPNTGCHDVGHVAGKTGWIYVSFDDGNAKLVCPECHAKARKLAEELCMTFGRWDVNAFSLISKELRDKLDSQAADVL